MSKVDWSVENAAADTDEEVSNDAVQLFTVATFNGLCRVIAALAQNGLLHPNQLQNIEDCMTAPLDDPDWRDDSFVFDSLSIVETVLAQAMHDASGGIERLLDD